jgi:hypothetical protein
METPCQPNLDLPKTLNSTHLEPSYIWIAPGAKGTKPNPMMNRRGDYRNDGGTFEPKRAKPGVGRTDSDRERRLGYEHLGGHNSHRKRDLEKGAALTWAHAAAHLDRSPVTSDYFLR